MDVPAFHPGSPMTDEECWAHLGEESFGRLAYRLVDEVHIVPLDVVAGDHRILFRTQAGNKLLAAALGSDVAFEIDWRGGGRAWSVVVRGRLRRFDIDEPAAAFPARSWIGEEGTETVELVVTALDGRWFGDGAEPAG